MKARSLIALLFACVASFSHAEQAQSYPDKLLTFRDLGVVAKDTYRPIHWLDAETVLVSTAPSNPKPRPAETDLVQLNVKTGETSVVATYAGLVCWVAREGFGVAHVGGPATNGAVPKFRRMVRDGQGVATLTDEPAERKDCDSRQYYRERGMLVLNLGRGEGVLVTSPPPESSGTATYIREDGTRIPLTFPGAQFDSARFSPWEGEFYVGRAPGGSLRMRPDGSMRVDTTAVSLFAFFKGPSATHTRSGYLVNTGVYDPYNGDTFFVPTGGTPVRIYKSKGGWDQLGPGGVSPDGCGVLLSMSADGPLNRVLAFANRAPQTLHYIDVCAAFPAR